MTVNVAVTEAAIGTEAFVVAVTAVAVGTTIIMVITLSVAKLKMKSGRLFPSEIPFRMLNIILYEDVCQGGI